MPACGRVQERRACLLLQRWLARRAAGCGPAARAVQKHKRCNRVRSGVCVAAPLTKPCHAARRSRDVAVGRDRVGRVQPLQLAVCGVRRDVPAQRRGQHHPGHVSALRV